MLLPLEKFEPIFTPLQNKKIGLIVNRGSVSDEVHKQGMFQLLKKFNINYIKFDIPKGHELNWNEKRFNSVDEYAVSGGGVMGKGIHSPPIDITYPPTHKLHTTTHLKARIKALKTGKKVTILPQSFLGKEDLPYHKVYAREYFSQQFYKGAELAPDLGLGLEWKKPVSEPTEDVGIWLKTRTHEGIIHRKENLGDPVQKCNTLEEYANLASKYRTIVTDRCHFAILALIISQNNYPRSVVVVPNSYHKNLGLYVSWLKNLGAVWYKEGYSKPYLVSYIQ